MRNDKKPGSSVKTEDVLLSISYDRKRTNFLRKYEQVALAYLVQRIPGWISSNMMTAIGFFGSLIVFAGFLLASFFSREFLLLGVLGFIVSWFGDSLDGRLAYYRRKPRKLYGFVIDISMDWISIILIGCGYIVYAKDTWELIGYAFVLMYGWEMIIALMRYKITGQYSIDAGKFGPTEARLIISAILISEVFIPGSLGYSVVSISFLLLVINIIDTRRLVITADRIDKSSAPDA
jgi:phosphatidylglycerophosphate synthase